MFSSCRSSCSSEEDQEACEVDRSAFSCSYGGLARVLLEMVCIERDGDSNVARTG